MKTLKTLTLLAVLLLAGSSAFAQTILTITTLGAAVTSSSANVVNLASITGVVVGDDLIVDQEVMQVETVPTVGNNLGVIRGYNVTQAHHHVSGAPVAVIHAAAQPYAVLSFNRQGACARGSSTVVQPTLYLPIFNSATGEWTDCIGGEFVTGRPTPLQVAPTLFTNVPTGGTIYTSINTNGTAPAASTDMYCSELDLPSARWLTGIQMLNGTSVATDHHQYSLYDATGNLIANTASIAAGSYGSASEYGGGAFTQLYPVQAGKYFTCFQSGGTTATIRMTLTQVNDYIATTLITGLTYATVPATIVAPTTFTTAEGPYSGVY